MVAITVLRRVRFDPTIKSARFSPIPDLAGQDGHPPNANFKAVMYCFPAWRHVEREYDGDP